MKIKSKILAILFLTTLMSASLLSSVEAKPGANNSGNPKFLDFVLHVEFASASDDYPSEWRWNPPSVMDDMVPPYSQYLAADPEGARVLFVKNRIWYLPTLPFPALRYVTIGDVDINLEPDDFYCLYDVTWIYSAGGFGIYNLETTVSVDSAEYSGTIKISSIEKVRVDMDQLVMLGEGTFVGHGEINGQNVKVSGERTALIDLTFVLPPTMEEKGTIQFQG